MQAIEADRVGNASSIQWTAGIYGGLIAGLVFGAMMGMMGMLEMVARVVRSDSALVGFFYHLLNSAVIGALFAPLLGRVSTDKLKGLGFGLFYGVIWWFLGPLILMPLLLGMGTMLSPQGMQMALPSLAGHLIFGGILGVLYPVFAREN